MPGHLQTLGPDGLKREMDRLRALWDLRDGSVRAQRMCLGRMKSSRGLSAPSVPEWEQTLVELVLGGKARNLFGQALQEDPAILLYQRLIEDIRAGVLTDNFRLSMRLIRLSQGEAFLRNLLENFWATKRPSPWGYEEAQAFGCYLRNRPLAIPHLEEVMGFEMARLQTMLSGTTRTVRFHTNPFGLLGALGEGRPPFELIPQEIDLEIVPD
jgi:hypothetical protein